MKKVKGKWSSTKTSKKVLLFVQIMEELLDDNVWDNYRAYTLDTIERVQDLKLISQGIERGEIKERYLPRAVEEAIWSIKTDPVVQNILADQLGYFIGILSEKNKKPSYYIYASNFVIEKIKRDYKSVAESLLLEKLFREGDRKEIRTITCCLCSFLIRRGYSKSYIAQILKEHLLRKSNLRVTSRRLEEFFSCFDFKEKDYKVYLRMKINDAKFLTSVTGIEIIQKNKIPKSYSKLDPTFFNESGFSILLMDDIKALDPYSARKEINYLISTFDSMTKLEPAVSQLNWDKGMFVSEKGARKGFRVYDDAYNLKRYQPNALGNSKKRFERLLESLFTKKLDIEARYRLISSINTYYMAIQSKNPDIQLVSLWSAIETLLKDKIPDSKFEYYFDYMVAAISSNYEKKCFEATFRDLKKIYKKKFTDILGNKKAEEAQLKYFIKVVKNKADDSKRSEIIRLVIENPLAAYRVRELHKKFSEDKKHWQHIDDHSKRVGWQLNRIYRVRNEIVHAGRSPKYIDSLLINLDTYYKLIVQAMVSRLSEYEEEVSIDQLLMDVKLTYSQKMKLLHQTKT